MAKWAITSDTQFDQQLSYSRIGPTGVSSRLTDSIACFDWIVSTAIERECKGLIHLGDLYDSRTTIDVSVLDAVGRSIYSAIDRGLEMVLMVGNHDSYLRNPSINSLWTLAGCATIVDEPMTIDRFAFVPWVEDDSVFEQQVAWLAENSKASVLFAHCMVEGAVPAAVGVGRPLAMLRPTRWKQVILGDVHDPVQVAKNVRYCGSPMQWHYGDADGKRGFLILDDETMKVEFIENEFSPRFHLLTEVAGEQVRKGDFVRVRTEDADVAREIVKSVQSHYPTRIDVETVEIEGTAPRLAVHAKDQHSEVLRRYIEYQGLGEVPGLVELGVEILEEARHG